MAGDRDFVSVAQPVPGHVKDDFLVYWSSLAFFLLRRGGRSKGPAAPAFACALGALVLYAIIATGRAGMGIETSGVSRYTYLVIALAVPAMGLARWNFCIPAPGCGPISHH